MIHTPLNAKEEIEALVARQRLIADSLEGLIHNPFNAEHWRKGKLIARHKGMNGITTEGKNFILDVMFGKGTPETQTDPWYIGLINNSPTPSLADGDTLASHSGWSESSDYSGNRKEWSDADASAGSKASSSTSDFAIDATVTIYGIFVCGVATGTSGKLWTTGAFTAPIALVNGDTLKVNYTIGF